MIVLADADLVLPDRLLGPATLVLEQDRIAEIRTGPVAAPADGLRFDLRDHLVAPGFIDVHVHGVDGIDVTDPGGIAR
ncbi:MAG TPA: hypothetical protein VNI83_16155, partial [Vicinamibacterales bacterium]|nr:hypothetical protein [Vicinamibacterales bacterium]